MSTKSPIPVPLRPTTAEQLLDREEDLAFQRIAGTVHSLGKELCTAVDLRKWVHRNPLLATGIAAYLGFVAGPRIPHALKEILLRTALVAAPAPMRPRSMPRFISTALRRARAARARVL